MAQLRQTLNTSAASSGKGQSANSKPGRASVADREPSAKTGGPGSPDYDVAIIGTGPYGLSAASYLKAKGLGVRIFGEPMEFWAEKMPEGMLLRSPRPASNLADPEGKYTLDAYERDRNLAPVHPIPLNHFVDYGRWFGQHLSGCLDRTMVAEVKRENSIFRLSLRNGTSVSARRVVVAAGIGPFPRKPAPFTNLPQALVSHCYEGRKIAEFVGKRVTVVGAGQSALESAALLHEAGAEVELVVRMPALRWIGQHPGLHRLGPISSVLYSKHDIGPMGLSRLVAYPGFMYGFPLGLKDKIRKRAVRSAGSAWLPARVAPIKVRTGCVVQTASETGGGLDLKMSDGSQRHVDHVLLGTGYDVDVAKYDFLQPEMAASIQKLDGYPDLAKGFVSSVPGLHFIGATAARNYGPLLYFVTGAQFACEHLTAHIVQNGTRQNRTRV